MERKNINEILKQKEAAAAETQAGGEETLRLDDARRVKVLSPSRLVIKRFMRNKLAIVGSAILIFMFVFCFLGPLFYPYGQTEVFYKVDILQNGSYANASIRTSYVNYTISDRDSVPSSITNLTDAYIEEMVAAGETERVLAASDGTLYAISYVHDGYYRLTTAQGATVGTILAKREIATYASRAGTFTFASGMEELSNDEGFRSAAIAAASGTSFEWAGKQYVIERQDKLSSKIYSYDAAYAQWSDTVDSAYDEAYRGAVLVAVPYSSATQQIVEIDGVSYVVTCNGSGTYTVSLYTPGETLVVATNRALSSYEGVILPDGFKSAAYLAVCDREEGFTYDEQSYTLDELGGEISILDASGATYAVFSQYSIARYTGEDTLAYARRLEIRQAIEAMNAAGETSWDFRMLIEQRDPDTSSVLQDENGNDIYAESDAKIERKNDRYEITTDSYTTLIDRYAKPGKGGSGFHLLGTDADGYDVLARIMYGGRVSLLVGFIVVIIESVLGIIMGGIAGYFGGWVDTVIMRLVDVFYCIPSMPILIILGALFDTLQMTPYVRLAWMMAVLGFLGWAGVARLVRGQILSLREQEFMVATEATGLRVNRRIFRHLVPNVMPQLIVTATAGLGGVILTESTLSFLGLGVKRPLSTWGAMINSVSSYTAMINYTYIWVPVGLLICLTVIAFNFVGDGLRDAFDPKMKR